MKKPYLTQIERRLINSKTLSGDCIMLRFRLKQCENEILKTARKIVDCRSGNYPKKSKWAFLNLLFNRKE